jgi:hypothetical protein
MALDLGVSRKWCGPAAIESQSCSPQETSIGQDTQSRQPAGNVWMCPAIRELRGEILPGGGVAQGPREGATATARGITEGLGGMRQRGWPG